jgi:hypothetical protein
MTMTIFRFSFYRQYDILGGFFDAVVLLFWEIVGVFHQFINRKNAKIINKSSIRDFFVTSTKKKQADLHDFPHQRHKWDNYLTKKYHKRGIARTKIAPYLCTLF